MASQNRVVNCINCSYMCGRGSIPSQIPGSASAGGAVGTLLKLLPHYADCQHVLPEGDLRERTCNAMQIKAAHVTINPRRLILLH